MNDYFEDLNNSNTIYKSVKNLFETDEETIRRLELDIKQLTSELSIERSMRYSAEKKIEELKEEINEIKTSKRVRRTKLEIEQEEIKEYTELKSDGKRKPRPAEPIRSYDDFLLIQNYFLDRENIRDWMLWTVGVSLGLRISDLFSLKFKNILNPDNTFRNKILIFEKKTSKLNNCLITDSVKYAVTKYLEKIKWNFKFEDYLFASRKTKSKMYEEYGWKILSDAGKALELPIVIGSHTMRKSFANIAVCVDKSSVDMNSITKIQGLLNHSDQKVTMRYLGTFQNMFDKARIAVSDFVLGKTDVNVLQAGNNLSINDLMLKLDSLEDKITINGGKNEDC